MIPSSVNGSGIYAIYEGMGRTPQKLLYIGETYQQTFSQRLKQHQRQWLHKIDTKLLVSFGKVNLPRGTRISIERILDIESCLIYELRPPYNSMSKNGHCGRDFLIFNMGKIGTINNIICADKELIKLIKINKK